ncbi:LysR family transcriptional regulator [Paraglaciecola aquimarina]|uniref:LysR family transcriptional regulator n=1 Tax=Paraglaciecola aquimarina TaxID=1235557 RepID=A0ABU3SU35_9ALTE|nr:LysR family transcriptional regulator [Paraglaciecola aquimarina]MDU0353516.1 LysR family transcriptional regulator [Paraglaciecola aquimarina]
MDIRFLVTFMEVAETRHFGKAAENLYLTQSAVSARIKQLEEYFNSALFVRNRNSLQLTVAGEKLLPYAETLAKTLNKARQALSDENVQQLTIACTTNAWDLHLKQQLTPLKTAFPEVAIKADVLTNEQLMRMVHEHAIDLAVTTIPFKSDDVETIELCASSLALYYSSKLSAETAKSQFIHIEWGKNTVSL